VPVQNRKMFITCIVSYISGFWKSGGQAAKKLGTR
jgi:hypothetical protein